MTASAFSPVRLLGTVQYYVTHTSVLTYIGAQILKNFAKIKRCYAWPWDINECCISIVMSVQKILTGIVIRAYKKDDNKTTHNRGPVSSFFHLPFPQPLRTSQTYILFTFPSTVRALLRHSRSLHSVITSRITWWPITWPIHIQQIVPIPLCCCIRTSIPATARYHHRLPYNFISCITDRWCRWDGRSQKSWSILVH